MEIVTELYDHQAKGVEKLRRIKVGALYMEMGTGKTRVALELIKIRIEMGKINHVLWLCPCSVKENLRRDLIKHIGEGFESYITICGIETLSSSIKKNFELLELVESNKVFLIVDESNLVKNHKAKRTSNIIRLSEKCTYKIILNGTPISRNEQDLYSQWYILDWRVLGYKSFWSFSANHLEYDEFVPGKIRRTLNTDYLVEKIAPYSYQVKKCECLDIPEKTYETIYYDLTNEQDTHYSEVADELMFKLNELKPNTIYRLFTGLQNVISGYIVDTEGENLKRERMFKNPFNNPRIQKLLEIISTIEDEKIIIFAKYTDEILEIVEVLNSKYGDDVAVPFYGDVTQKNRQLNIEKFKGKSKYLIANKQCGAYGLNLQFCNYIIYYNNDWDYSTRIQSEDRVHRIGQNKNVHIVDMCASYTLDERIIKCLVRKENLIDSFKNELERTKDKIALLKWITGQSSIKKINKIDKSDLVEEENMVNFSGDYNKKDFYCYMGKYFAEREYRKLMPYLINDTETVWNIQACGNDVNGFIGYKENKNTISIVYCYVDTNYKRKKDLYKKLINTVPKNKRITIALEKHFDIDMFLNNGFTIYKESVNYWYMELVKEDEKVC